MKLTEHFDAEEFFPPGYDFTGRPELVLTELFCLTVLEPWRAVIDSPIYINGPVRTQAGWRERGIDAPGAAGNGSDHMLVNLSPDHVASGAADLLTPGVPLCEAASAFARMMRVGRLMRGGVVQKPREIIYERRGDGAEWLHVGYPPQFKLSAGYHAAGGVGLARPLRARETGGPWRFWEISIDGDRAERWAVEFVDGEARRLAKM